MTSHSKLYYYRKINGKAIPQNGQKPLREVILENLERFKENELFTVSIKPYKAQRSNSQNRYMHFIFNMIAEHTGQDMDTIKKFHKDNHLPTEYVEVGGIKTEKEKHTSELNTEQQEIFMERIRKFWFDFDGTILPLPNEIELED